MSHFTNACENDFKDTPSVSDVYSRIARFNKIIINNGHSHVGKTRAKSKSAKSWIILTVRAAIIKRNRNRKKLSKKDSTENDREK